MSASEARWTTGLGSIRTRCAHCSPCPCRFGVMRRFGVMAWSRIGMRPRVQALARCRPGGARARRGPAVAAAEQRQHRVRLGGQLAAAIGRDCSRRAAGSARCAQNTHGRTEHRTVAAQSSESLGVSSKAYGVVRDSSMRAKQKPPRHANPIVGIRLVRATFHEGSPRGVLRAPCVVNVMRASDSYTLQRTRRSIRC